MDKAEKFRIIAKELTKTARKHKLSGQDLQTVLAIAHNYVTLKLKSSELKIR